MTVLRTVRAAEPTAAFSPQRKCKTVWFKSSPRNQNQKKQMRVHLLFRFDCNEAHLRCKKNEVAFGYEACLRHIEK